MSVHYKFKSARSYDTIAFDGLHISVRDLKKAILHQKQIGKSTDFDLQITNAHSNEVYTDDGALIPKNSSLIVSRIPLTAQQKKAWEKSDAAQLHLINLNKGDSPEHLSNNKFARSADLTSIDASEEDKIQAAIHQSTRDYDPSNYVRIKNSNQVGEVPSSYRCYKCMQPGHWIKDCKLNSNQDASVEIRKSTGIPRSFMVPVEGPEVPGAMMTPTGHFAVPTIDHEARREMPKKVSDSLIMEKPPIPNDIVCGVCKDLLTDAVMIPCCGNSFCDECIRNVLLESEDHQCPDCKEKDVSPDTLIPSRFLRNCVNNFKNQTGYTRTTPLPVQPQTRVVQDAHPPTQSLTGHSSGVTPQVPSVQVQVSHTAQSQLPPVITHHLQPGMTPSHGKPGYPSHSQPRMVHPPPPGVTQHVSPPGVASVIPPPGPPPLVPTLAPSASNGQKAEPSVPANSVPTLSGIAHRPTENTSSSQPSQSTITIEVPDGDDDVRPGSPAGKSIPSLSAPLPNNPPFIRHNINHNPPFLAQTVGVPGQAPPPQLGSHPQFSLSFRGRSRDGVYGSDHLSGRGRGYPPPGGCVRPLVGNQNSHQPIHPPPHLHFTQGGRYVFQPVYPPGSRSDGADDRTDYRGISRSLGNGGDALEKFQKYMEEKDKKKTEKKRSRSRSYSRSWSRSPRWHAGRSRSRTPKARLRSPKGRSRSPKGRSRTPKGRSRSPKGRSRSPKGKSRSPLHKRTSPLKRSPLMKRSPGKNKAASRLRSRSPPKRSISKSRSRSPYIKRRSRSRSHSKSYSFSRSRSRSSELRRPIGLRRDHKRSNYSRTPPPGTGPSRSPPSHFYGDRKYKTDSRSHKPTSSAIRSSVYKTHDYGTSHEHSRYGDRNDREYQSSRNYLKQYDNLDNDPKIGQKWEWVLEREMALRKKEGYETYGGDRRERGLSRGKIIQNFIERDKERDRINELESGPLVHSGDLISPNSSPEKTPEKEKKSRKEKKKKREDSDKKKKKRKPKEKEEKKPNEETRNETEEIRTVTEVTPDEKPVEPLVTVEPEEIKPGSNSQPDVKDNPTVDEKPQLEVPKGDDLYKDLDANVDMKPFENVKVAEKSDSPVKKLPEADSTTKDVMLAPVPELSKWEKDDLLINLNEPRPLELDTTDDLEEPEEQTQVTSEVLKRAENAVFKKGVNPIKEAALKVPEKKEKREKDDKKDKDEKKEIEEKKPKEIEKREREFKREKDERKEREDKRERDEKRDERDRRREIEKRERERIIHKEPILLDQYSKDMKLMKSIALPIKTDLDESTRRRKTDRIVLEKTRISAKERLGAKVDEKSSKREIKYGKVPKSDQEVLTRVLHRGREHPNYQERKVSLSGKDDVKKDHLKRKGAEGCVYEISDEDRELKESNLLKEAALISKGRSNSMDLMGPPMKKKSKLSPKPEESSEEASSDESVETPKKHKKKKKNKRKKKSKKKSKSKHESSSDSGSSTSSSDSESDDESKKKKKHKHRSRKKSKKHKKSKK